MSRPSQKRRLKPLGLLPGTVVALGRGAAGMPIRREELGKGPLTRDLIGSLDEACRQLLAKPRWSREEVTKLSHIAVALRRVRPKTYHSVLEAFRDRLEKALFHRLETAPLPELAMATDHLASPDPKVERFLAIANLERGISTQILDSYPVSEETQVHFFPEPIDLVTRKQLEEEFSGKRALVIDPHSDDAPLYIGSLLANVISKVAKAAVHVTVTLDPLGVTDEYAANSVRWTGRPMPTSQKGWIQVKEEIRAKEAQEIANALGMRSFVLRDPVRLVEGRYDPKGKLLPYYSTFTPPSSSTLRKLLRLFRRFQPDAVLLPLASGHYHQMHRDSARLALQAIVKEYLPRSSRRLPELYFYSDSLMNLFGLYGLRPNITHFYSVKEEEKKLAALSLIPSQINRNPHYPEQIKAKDLMTGVIERARHSLLEAKGKLPDLYAEHLLKVKVVPKWSPHGAREPRALILPSVTEEIRSVLRPFFGEDPSLEIVPYDPFGLLPGRYFAIRRQGIVPEEYLIRIHSSGVDAIWKLPPNHLKPGHGLFLAEHLETHPAETLVDLGTGPLGFLVILGAYRGCSKAFAVDINPNFVKTAKESAAFNGFHKTVRILRGNLFEPLGTQRVHQGYFHPPMLPARKNGGSRRISHYDEGGATGRETLDQAIGQAPNHLLPGGEFRIGQFEFLGADRCFGKPASTFEQLRRHGFHPRALGAYEVPLTPILQERLASIRKIYPDYRFTRRNGRIWHRFVIVAGRLAATK